MALNSATRLLVITAVALAIAFIFKSNGGLAVVFGLAIFQALLVMSTSIPVLRKIRGEGLDVDERSAKTMRSPHGIDELMTETMYQTVLAAEEGAPRSTSATTPWCSNCSA